MILLANQETEQPEESQSPAEELTIQDRVKALVGAVKKNLTLIIGIAVVLAIVFVYLFVLPKPGTITLRVVELDNEAHTFTDADVEIQDAVGNVVSTAVLEDGGAVVPGVPSGELRIVVNPLKSGFDRAQATLVLASGGRATVEVKVPRKADLDVGNIPDQKIGSGCSKTVALSVKNNDENEFTAELVGEPEDFEKGFSSTDVKTIPGQASDTLSFTVTVPTDGNSVSGTVRVKYTNAGTPFSASIVEPPEMRVDPGDISIRCSSSGCDDAVQVTINNYGRGDLTDLSNELSSEISDSVEIVGFENKPIKPNSRTTFFVRGKPSGIGKVGKLKILSGCGEEEIPISIRSS